MIVLLLDVLVGFEHIRVTTIANLVVPVLPSGWLAVLGCNSTFTHKFTAFFIVELHFDHCFMIGFDFWIEN